MRGHDVKGVRETESVESLQQKTSGVVDVDRTAGGRTRIGLCHEKEFMDGVELDIRSAEELVLAGVRQDHNDSGLRAKIVKFHAGVIFCRRARAIVGGINGDAVHESESNTGELRECSLDEIRQADYRRAAKTSVASCEHCLVCPWIVAHGRSA